jgi:molybdate transport system substrate-binding protein
LSSCIAPLLVAGLAFAQPQPPTLLIAAAADLASVETPLLQAFTRSSGIPARFVLGASGMLARQIEQGAPYDVFLSANESFVTELARAGKLAPDSVTVYASGRLGLWSKSGDVKALADLRKPAVLHVAMANPAHAPYGLAAKQALENQGLWKELERRVVYGENVRQALQFAESGNADAVLTAWTLLFDRGGILLPDAWHAPIRQACGMAQATRNPETARKFLRFLTSPEGRRILESRGLFPPSSQARHN